MGYCLFGERKNIDMKELYFYWVRVEGCGHLVEEESLKKWIMASAVFGFMV